MDLTQHGDSVPLPRSWNIPDSTRNVCCVVMREALNRLKDFAAENPALKIRLLLIPDLPDNGPKQAHLPAPVRCFLLPY